MLSEYKLRLTLDLKSTRLQTQGPDLIARLVLGLLSLIIVPRAAAREPAMAFSLHSACPGSGCDSYILAQGPITADTPAKFTAFVKRIDWMPRVYFDSPGGDLHAGLELGRLIRRRRLDTLVGGNYEEPTDLGRLEKVIVAKPRCFSACAYAFLGGVGREVAADSAIGVHQFRSARSDVGEASAQAIVTAIALYLDDMGIDRRLLDVASATPGIEIALLTMREAQQLGVDNSHPPLASWQAKVDQGGHLRACVTQAIAARSAALQWCIVRPNAQQWRAELTYVLHQSFRPQPEVLEALNDRINGLRRYKPQDYEHSVLLEQVTPWRRSAESTYTTTVELDTNALDLLRAEPQLRFDGDTANVWRDLSPSVTLGLQGLPPLLQAIERQTP